MLGWRRFTECFAGINIWFIVSERFFSFPSGWWKQKDGCCTLDGFVPSSNTKFTLLKWEVPGTIFYSFLHYFFNLTHILFYGTEKETLAVKCQMPPLTYHFFLPFFFFFFPFHFLSFLPFFPLFAFDVWEEISFMFLESPSEFSLLSLNVAFACKFDVPKTNRFRLKKEKKNQISLKSAILFELRGCN